VHQMRAELTLARRARSLFTQQRRDLPLRVGRYLLASDFYRHDESQRGAHQYISVGPKFVS